MAPLCSNQQSEPPRKGEEEKQDKDSKCSGRRDRRATAAASPLLPRGHSERIRRSVICQTLPLRHPSLTPSVHTRGAHIPAPSSGLLPVTSG